MGSLGQLLSSIFTGGIGLNQLFGGGATSVSGSAAAGAAAASPFSGQFAGYQPQLQSQISGLEGLMGQASNAIAPEIGGLLGLGGNATQSQLAQMFQQGTPGVTNQLNSTLGTLGGLSTQFGQQAGALTNALGSIPEQAMAYEMSPGVNQELQYNLGNVNRTLMAGGYGGSGQQQKALYDYADQFSSQAYQQQFQNLLGVNQQQYGQLANTFGQQASTTLQGGQLGINTGLQQNQQQFGQGSTLQQLLAGQFGQAGSLQATNNQQQLGTQSSLIQQLLAASGVTTGSPATAGGILSGQFGNGQQAAANLGSGLAGGLNSLLGGQSSGLFGNNNGLSNILSNLFSGGNASAIGSFGGDLSGALSSIFGGTGGALGSAGDVLGSELGLGGIFGGAGSDALGAAAGVNSADALGSFASLLGFNSGTAAAAGAGAADAGAAGAGIGGGLGGLGAASLVAAPFALAIGGMLGGLLGYGDNGTPYTQANDAWAQAVLHDPSLLAQYGFGDVTKYIGTSDPTLAQLAQSEQSLNAMSGGGAFFGSFLGNNDPGGGG